MTKLATEQHNLALNTQPSSLKFGPFIILLPDEAIALKQLLENQFIHPDVIGGHAVVNRIIKFANEQLSNRGA